MLKVKVWTMALGCFTAATFALCVVGGLIAPGLPIRHVTLQAVLPGFVWISPAAFLLGLAESFFLGVYAGLVFVPLHNLFARRWGRRTDRVLGRQLVLKSSRSFHMNRVDLRAIVFLGVVGLTACVPLRGAHLPPSPDLLTKAQVLDLAKNAKTPADHTKLQRHFLALAAKYDAEAADHEALAEAYRRNPTASETKRPGSLDTAAHCERFARLAHEAAQGARDLAADHERMASGKASLNTDPKADGRPAGRGGTP